MRGLWRYWGYLALALAIFGLVTHTFAYTVILIFSVGAIGYFLIQAPVWCGAMTRAGQMCRNNATGLLLGCHLREHKWQKIKMTFVPRMWRELNRGLWASPKEVLATLGGVASLVSLVVALVPVLAH